MELGAYALISNGQLALQRIPHKDHCLDFGAENVFLLDRCVAHDGDVFGAHEPLACIARLARDARGPA